MSTIKQVISQQSFVGEPIPSINSPPYSFSNQIVNILNLEKDLKMRSIETSKITLSELKSRATACGIEPSELKTALDVLTSLGSIVHFDDDDYDLKNIVILSTNWLAKLFSTIITTKYK